VFLEATVVAEIGLGTRPQGLLLPAVSVLMAVVGLLAVVGPARRGLRVQPTEALREG
jgi:ABC-type lipoprotein release transport system permease subunit